MTQSIKPVFNRLLEKLAVCAVLTAPMAARAQTFDPMGSIAASIDQSTTSEYLDMIRDKTRQWETMRNYKDTPAAEKVIYVDKIEHAAQALAAENAMLCNVTNKAADRVHEHLLKLAGCAMGISADLDKALDQSAELIRNLGAEREILMSAGKVRFAQGQIILQNAYVGRLSHLAAKLQ